MAATSLVVTGLSASTRYYWYVAASNAGGTSSNSVVWMVTTGTSIAVAPAGSGAKLGGENSIPSEFALGQNCPNPFNPITTIDFALPEMSDVTIEVFNVIGQKVRTLLQGKLGPGNHQIQWNGQVESGGAAATGVYFYRLVAGDFVQTKKMLLLK